jgi:hypothetical protein
MLLLPKMNVDYEGYECTGTILTSSSRHLRRMLVAHECWTVPVIPVAP